MKRGTLFFCGFVGIRFTMILRSLASNQPYTLIYTPIAIVGLLFPLMSGANIAIADTHFPMDSWLAPLYPFPKIVFGILVAVIGLGAWIANHVFNKHEFLNVPVFVPAFLYGVAAAGWSLIEISIPLWVASIFVLLGLNRHLEVFRQQRVLSFYFESAFCYGLAGVVFPPFVILLPGMLIAVLVIRAFQWRELLIPLIAFAVPFLYWMAWMFIFHDSTQWVLFFKAATWDSPSFWPYQHWTEKTFAIACVCVWVAALPRYLFPSDRGSNKSKGVKNVLFIMALTLLCAIGVGYFLLDRWMLGVGVIPIVFITGYWFSNYRYSFIAPFFFYAFCLSALILSLRLYA